jgi:hypothetical protein
MNTDDEIGALPPRDKHTGQQTYHAPKHWNPRSTKGEIEEFNDRELQQLVEHLWIAQDYLINAIATQNERMRQHEGISRAGHLHEAQLWDDVLRYEDAICESTDELSQYASNILVTANRRSLRSTDRLKSTVNNLRSLVLDSRKRTLDLEQGHSPTQDFPDTDNIRSSTSLASIQFVTTLSGMAPSQETSEVTARTYQRDDESQGALKNLLAEFERLKTKVEAIGLEVRDLRLVPAILGVPLDQEDLGAVRDRVQVLKTLYEELEYQKREFLEPAIAEGQASLEVLNAFKVSADVFQQGLERGNVGAVVIVESILKDLVREAQEARQHLDPGVLKELDKLEEEVTLNVLDVRLQVVPSGMINFARRILEDSSAPQEIRLRSQLAQEIIKLVKEYLGNS